jgi:hypothetical protein
MECHRRKQVVLVLVLVVPLVLLAVNVVTLC